MLSQTALLKFDKFCNWNGILYILLIFLGWWGLAGFFPLHQPGAPKADIVALYAGNEARIKIGMIFVMWSAMTFIFFGAVIAKFVRRYEGGAKTLTFAFAFGAFANAMLTFYPAIWWAIAAFREDQPAEILYFINDAGWLQFLGGVSLVVPMFVVMAFIALSDSAANPVFPRWTGYFNIWVAITMIPDQGMFLFKDGPFAWNGLLAMWLPVGAICTWFIVTFIYIRRALNNPAVYLPELAEG